MHAGRTPLALLRLVCFLTAALIASGMLAGCAPEKNSSKPVPLAVGEIAPDFSLVTVNGELYRLEQFRGHTVVVYFWTSWCQTCQEDMTGLAKRYQQNTIRGPMVLAVNSEEQAGVVANYARNPDIPFPLLVDIDGRVGDLFGVETIPTTYLIDANGVVQQIHVGTMSGEVLDAIMAAKSEPEPTTSPTATLSTDPTITPTATTIPSLTACVTAGVLNVREGPSTTAPVLDGMGKGECAVVDARSSNSEWLRLQELIAGKRGWVAAKFMVLDGPLDALAVSE